MRSYVNDWKTRNDDDEVVRLFTNTGVALWPHFTHRMLNQEA